MMLPTLGAWWEFKCSIIATPQTLCPFHQAKDLIRVILHPDVEQQITISNIRSWMLQEDKVNEEASTSNSKNTMKMPKRMRNLQTTTQKATNCWPRIIALKIRSWQNTFFFFLTKANNCKRFNFSLLYVQFSDISYIFTHRVNIYCLCGSLDSVCLSVVTQRRNFVLKRLTLEDIYFMCLNQPLLSRFLPCCMLILVSLTFSVFVSFLQNVNVVLEFCHFYICVVCRLSSLHGVICDLFGGTWKFLQDPYSL